MTKKEIYNNYAIEQGYDDFNHLILDDMFEGDFNNIMKTINAVTDLIQEKLKRKIYINVSESVLGNVFKCGMLEDKILKTEIL